MFEGWLHHAGDALQSAGRQTNLLFKQHALPQAVNSKYDVVHHMVCCAMHVQVCLSLTSNNSHDQLDVLICVC